ncbi:MAG: ABC transporter substrate-binding protein [Nocardioides sp.]
MPSPRRHRLVLAALLLAVTSACGSENATGTVATSPDPQPIKEGVLQVCTDIPYEPFEFTRKGEPVGFDVELVDAVADRLELELAMVDTSFDDITSGSALNDNTCDMAISAMTITGERARVLDFSSPYFNASQALVVGAGSAVTTLADLGGLKVGVQAGTTGELYVTDNAPSEAEIVPFDDSAAMDAAMRDGDVDAAVYDNTVVGDVVESNPSLVVVAEFDTGEQYGMAVRRNGNDDLLRVINDVLASIRDDGGYDRIFEKWFGATGA